MIKKLNQAYDRIKEPYRFLTLLAVVAPALALTFFGSYAIQVTGFGYLMLLMLFRIPFTLKRASARAKDKGDNHEQ